jgi:lycopene elongase/hydratase (dihydrobisanhydrobacterioruberin-forming)
VSGAAPQSAEHGDGVRRIGYRLIPGNGFDYLLHMRPREWPIMVAHTALGYLLARGIAGGVTSADIAGLVPGLLVWVLLLNGGTLALNSAFDHDEGDIGYLDHPPPAPRRLARWGFGLMLAGQAIALALPRGFVIAYAICFAMSVLYSVPPIRLKAVAGADWIINMIGFGTLTPYAGWALSRVPLTHAGAWALGGFAPLFAALYPLTQIYQLDEDRARGDRTLAIALGVRWSLGASIAAVVVAFACFVKAARLSSNHIGGDVHAAFALGVAAVMWLAVLIPWIVRGSGLPPAAHKRGMYAALMAWAVTDVAVLVAIN